MPVTPARSWKCILCMNLNILPALPADPAERQAYMNTWENEIRVVRKRPSFIIGMVLAAASALTLIALTEGVAARLAVIMGVFGVAAVYDTVTRHFCLLVTKGRLEKGGKGTPVPDGGASA